MPLRERDMGRADLGWRSDRGFSSPSVINRRVRKGPREARLPLKDRQPTSNAVRSLEGTGTSRVESVRNFTLSGVGLQMDSYWNVHL